MKKPQQVSSNFLSKHISVLRQIKKKKKKEIYLLKHLRQQTKAEFSSRSRHHRRSEWGRLSAGFRWADRNLRDDAAHTGPPDSRYVFVGNSRLRERRGPVYYDHVGGLRAQHVTRVGNTCYPWHRESVTPKPGVVRRRWCARRAVVERVVYGPVRTLVCAARGYTIR